MANQVILCGDRSKLVKFIQVSQATPYSNRGAIQLGLHALSNSPFNNLVEDLNTQLSGRITPVSLAEANRIAQLISDHIRAPVNVIKELKRGCFESPAIRKITAQDNDEDIYSPTMLEFTSIEHFRTVVEYLKNNSYLSVEDTDALDPFIKDVESLVANHRSMVSTLSQQQQDIFSSLAKPLIENIIQSCASYSSPKNLLGTSSWAVLEEPIDIKKITRAILYESCQSSGASLFLEKFPGIKGAMDSANKLHAIYHGEAALESTYQSSGHGLPSLEAQRSTLANLIEEIMVAKFGHEATQELGKEYSPQLVSLIRRRLFCEGYHLDMIVVDYSKQQPVIQVNTFKGTIDALQGNFGHEISDRFIPKHVWISPDRTYLQGEAAKVRMDTILSEERKELSNSIKF